MPTTYPTSLDSFTNPDPTDQTSSPSHAGQHADINDAMEAVQARLGTSAFTTFTPDIAGHGTATFSTRTGYHMKIGKLVFVNMYITCNGAGSGSSNVQISGPSEIERLSGVRQMLSGTVEGGTGGSGSGSFSLVALAGGSGAAWDRVRQADGGNVVGSELVSGMLLTFTGWYREA